MPSISALSRQLQSGATTGRKLLEAALARTHDPAGEGRRVFTRLYDDSARVVADSVDKLRAAGIPLSPLAGIPISIKDLFDVAGETTCAGSVALRDAAPAEADADIVTRLRAAGAVIVGRTNMTEFAFSGLGLNPHYGTPANPFDRAARRIPGGSSSGAAVSIADGMAIAAIGTDTGGSTRIPPALCGIVGFKPTQRRISLRGAFPLSTTLDSVGPLAHTVGCCALLDAIMAGEPAEIPEPFPLAGARLAVPQTHFLEELEPAVATAFERAVAALARAGGQICEIPLAEMKEFPHINRLGFSPPEAYARHRRLLESRQAEYDPRIATRILTGRDMSAADFIDLCRARRDFAARVDLTLRHYDAWLAPTVPRVAPRIDELERDDALYLQTNRHVLRNTAIVNFLDGCALTLPCHEPGTAPVGLMLAGRHGADRQLLALGLAVEAALSQADTQAPP